MPPSLRELGLDQLSAADRLTVAEAIWDSVALEAEANPLPESQRLEIERRLAESNAHPGQVIAWEKVRADALARVRR